MAHVSEQPRLRALLEAGIALTSELSLDAVLQRLVETAAELTAARYAALGVIDPTGHLLERFITHGIDDETSTTIGEPPHGRGILGVLIRDRQPLRLHDLTQDPRSVGFPPGHPPMRSFLGVPVVLRGVAFGNLYLTEKAGGADFTDDDEELVKVLAAQAAVAVENARLYESATRWSRQLESLNEIGNALASEVELPALLELIATRLRELVGSRLVLIALPYGRGRLRVESASGEGEENVLGMSLEVETSKLGRVFERRRSERVDSLFDDPEVDQIAARRLSATTALYVPLVVRDRSIGVLNAVDKLEGEPRRFSDDDLRLAEAFAARAAIAVDLSERITRDALRRVVEAQEVERRRLARELHDEIGQDLTSLLLGLRTLEEAGAPEDQRKSVAVLRDMVVTALHDVRRLAVELRPKALDDFGLVPALERLATTFAEQTGMSVDVEDRLVGERLAPDAETALYRIVQEALTNTVKHAHARNVSILLIWRDGRAAAVIEDDGQGFDPKAQTEGLGLLGMRERLALLDGDLVIESGPGGTTLVAEVSAL
jgi:two-component system, NarL family, sensor histidine kinase DevS